MTAKPRADEAKTSEAKTSETSAAPTPVEQAKQPEQAKAAEQAKQPARAKTDVTGRETDCVVDDGTPHMGLATHGGRVCSAHAVHYEPDGTRRGQ